MDLTLRAKLLELSGCDAKSDTELAQFVETHPEVHRRVITPDKGQGYREVFVVVRMGNLYIGRNDYEPTGMHTFKTLNLPTSQPDTLCQVKPVQTIAVYEKV